MAKNSPMLPKSTMVLRCLFVAVNVFALLFLCRMVSMQYFVFEEVDQTNYIIETEECQTGKKIYMLVIVGSHPDHVEMRNAIRQTWSKPRLKNYPFKVIFVFGKVASGNQQQQLEAEHAKHGDILEGKFIDSYHNVMTRDLMGFEWASKHCQHAKYILRADDDIALDIFKVINELDGRYSNTSNLIACFAIITKAAVRRTGRYSVPLEDFPFPYYADYCDGWFYVLTVDTARKITQIAPQNKPIWINDVHIAGTLVKYLGLEHKLLNIKHTYSYNNVVQSLKRYNDSNDYNELYDLGPVEQDVKLFLKLQEIYKTKAIKQGFIFEA